MIPDFKTYIRESVWSDIHKRSNGETVRKEDDIELLDRDGLYHHIYDIYKQIKIHPLPLKSETTGCLYFSIPLFSYRYRAYRLDVSFGTKKIIEIAIRAELNVCEGFRDILQEKYNVIEDSNGIHIENKDGTVTNKLCMDVIQIVVENAPEPYFKKRED